MRQTGEGHTVKAWARSGALRADHRSNVSPRSITMHGGNAKPAGSMNCLSSLSTMLLTCMAPDSSAVHAAHACGQTSHTQPRQVAVRCSHACASKRKRKETCAYGKGQGRMGEKALLQAQWTVLLHHLFKREHGRKDVHYHKTRPNCGSSYENTCGHRQQIQTTAHKHNHGPIVKIPGGGTCQGGCGRSTAPSLAQTRHGR
jgi:hypothetical protein